MPSQVTNYQCPACTGPLHFVGSSGKLECDYCGSTFTVEQIEKLMAEKEAQAQAAFDNAQPGAKPGAPGQAGGVQSGIDQSAGEWDDSAFTSDWGADAAHLKAYNCPSCGAELICDETTAATSCPYCGNPTVVPGQFSGALKPELVIPFKLDKNAAMDALKRHYKGKPFLPRSFTEENHIQEIKGVYVPFWLYDGVVHADMEFEATTSLAHREGPDLVTVTRHFRVRRVGDVAFEKVPADASTKMPDDYMDSIEPYDYSAMVPFSTAYLPGFLADRYDVSADESSVRAFQRCENSAVEEIASTVQGYESCVPLSQNLTLRKGKVHYALMPVWLLSTQWGGKNYLFAMNGQTGRMVGDLPTSTGKFWGTFAAIAGVLAAIMAGILFL